MKRTASIFFVFVIAFLTNSCSKEEPYIITCADGPVKWRNLGSFNFTLQNLGFDTEDSKNDARPIDLLINSEPEYLHYFKAETAYANVDFDSETLLYIRRGDRIAYQGTQTVIADCENNEIRWLRDASKDPGNGPDELVAVGLALVIPKVKDKTKLVFSANYVK